MNLECAARQSFGARYERTSSDEVLAGRVKDGRLIMSPHPEWSLPENPDWLADPFGDDNWKFQYHSLRWLDPLRRRAILGDEEALELWERYAQSWIASNPPGVSPTKWAWIDMGDALRTYELSFALNMYETPPAWLVGSLQQHMHWLADEPNLGHGNHALHQHQALFVAASILEVPELSQLAIQRLEVLAQNAYDAQGINEEGSISYQEANFRWWNEAIHRLELEGIPRPAWAENILLAPESLAHATQPDGKYVRIGDMDSGSPANIDSPCTRYVTSAGAQGEAPEDLIKVYDRGYVYGRSGWGETERDFSEETFFSLCFGNQRKIHGQADGGSLTFFANGTAWIIDTGKFLYGRDPMRTYVVNRTGHNLLVAEGRKYNRETDVTLVRKSESGRHFEAAIRDTGYDEVLMTRRVIYSKRGEYLFVLDAVSSSEDVEITQRWHINEAAQVKTGADHADVNCNGAEFTIQWVGRSGAIGSVKGQKDPHDGWTSTGWRKNTPTTVVTARQKGQQLTFRTVLGAKHSSAAQPVEARKVAPGYMEYRISGRVGPEFVLVGKRGAVISDHPFQTDHVENYFTEQATGTAASGGRIEQLFGLLKPGACTTEQRRDALHRATSELERLGLAESFRSGLVAQMIDAAGDDLALPQQLRDATLRRSPSISWIPESPISNRAGIIRSYAERSTAAADSAFAGVQSFPSGPLTQTLLSMPGNGPILHVSFHGALDRGKYALPRFERGQSLSDLGLPQLVFADPTLDLDPDLSLGWFLGTAGLDLHAEIARFTRERAAALGAERVVLSGSSGGGFAALQVAAFIPNSTVLAFNPQTNVAMYHPRLARKATDLVFPHRDVGDAEIAPRIDAARRYQDLNPNVHVVFVQNDGDSHHSRNHREPFIASTAPLEGVSTRTITQSWGKGHRSPNAKTYLQLLQDTISNSAEPQENHALAEA